MYAASICLSSVWQLLSMYFRLPNSSTTAVSSDKSASHFSNSAADPICRSSSDRYRGSSLEKSDGSSCCGTNLRTGVLAATIRYSFKHHYGLQWVAWAGVLACPCSALYCMDVSADANSRDLAIDVQNVGVVRSNRWILKSITWQIPQSTCAAILGPNGSGKSTLARILSAYLWPSEGNVRVLGEHFGDCDMPALRSQIKMVQPAGPYDVDPSLSALEVVLTGFFNSIGLYHTPTPAMQTEANRLLRQV